MSEDKFDAIVVGAGIAGLVAGYLLAKDGQEVLVIERGNYAGAKNMTGGRLYAHSLEKIMPGFASEAPVERRVTKEKISFLTEDDAVTVEFQAAGGAQAAQASYSVLRAHFDQWLMAQAEEAGAQIIPGVRVDELLLTDGRVTGVRAGDEELEAEVVILADGVNSILGEKLGMVKPVEPHNVAVGAKELIELPRQVIEDRFNLSGDEGAAWLFAGSPSNGLMGGGFLYTNKDSVSLGMVCGLGEIEKSGKSVPQMLEDFKNHPAVQPLVRDGNLIEYSAHLVPEGGFNMVPKLAGDGVLIVGDAAGLCLNVGFTIRGMDLAVASAEAAALTVIEAKKKGDYSEAALGAYRRKLEEGSVLKDMRLYSKLPAFMEQNKRIFTEYPQLAANIMRDVFTINGEPQQPMRRRMFKHLKEVGLINLVKDLYQGARAL